MNIVILAAGQGKRMMSSIPKVLHPLAGVPMVLRVIAAARSLSPKQIVAQAARYGDDAQHHRYARQRVQHFGYAAHHALALPCGQNNDIHKFYLFFTSAILMSALND